VLAAAAGSAAAGAGLGAVLAMPALSSPALAAEQRPLSVFAHKVHQTVATGAQGGDITRPWTQATGVAVEWTTFDTDPLGERLMREASLDSTTVDVGFLVNTQLVPRITDLFEPLDEWMARDPIEDPADVFPGLMSGMRVSGRQIGMPFRHASSGMHYNEVILAEHGFSEPPGTIEAMAEMARACSGRRGAVPVVGLVTPGVTYPNVIDIARAWNGDFITQDFHCVADQKPMLNAIHLLRDLFLAGAFPRNFAALGTEDVSTWMQTGRGVICLQSMGRNRIFNDPSKSRFPGKIQTVAVPISETLKSQFDVAPAKVEFWGMVIPRHAQRKELSWSFIKAMLTKQATLDAALNGNGPVRNSTYDDPRLRQMVSYADEERRVLKVARLPLPAFDEAARAADIFREEAEAAVLGLKTPEIAMASVVTRVKPLLPA
jgi:multiple sugar transport system substrate-binding protein